MERFACCLFVEMTRFKQPTDINFSELQKTLDAQGIEIVDNQKESVVGRKALADKTKGNVHSIEVTRYGI
jgi:hypothetical protein